MKLMDLHWVWKYFGKTSNSRLVSSRMTNESPAGSHLRTLSPLTVAPSIVCRSTISMSCQGKTVSSLSFLMSASSGIMRASAPGARWDISL